MTKKRPSIKLLAPIYIAFPVVFLAIILSFLWNVQSRNSIEIIYSEYTGQVHGFVKKRIDQMLSVPIQVTEINKSLYQNNLLDINDLNSWESTFKDQFNTFKTLSSIVWGDSEGRAVWIGRYADGSIYWAIKDDPKSSKMYEWKINSNGERIEASKNSFEYNLFERPWYIGPKKSRRSQWTSPFIWAGGEDSKNITLGISYGNPIFDSMNNFLGVMDADYSLKDLSLYLKTIKISKTGAVLIVSSEGVVIASSIEIDNINKDGSLVKLNELDHSLAQISTFVNSKILSSDKQNEILVDKVVLDNRPVTVSASDLGREVGLNWNLITVVPDEDFLAQIDSNYFNSKLITVVMLFISLCLGLIASSWLLKPLLKLIKFIKVINAGSLDTSIDLKHTPEYEELGSAINKMLKKLNDSRKHEVLLNRELDHRVKNMLAQLVTICRQAELKSTQDKQIIKDLSKRIAGVAKIHELLASSGSLSVILSELIVSCTEPYLDEGKDIIKIRGPIINLNSKSVLCLGMVLNELSTNAAKYGSLSGVNGKIDVSWSLDSFDGLEKLSLEWVEDSEIVHPSSSRIGFGTKIIKSIIPYELDGEVKYLVEGGKVKFKAIIPIDKLY